MRVHANRRIVLTLLGLAALAVCALAVLSPRSTATPQTQPGTCCSSPTVSSTTASEDIVPADMQTDPADPPGTIDGAKNPELIPDEVAYRVMLLSLAEPQNPTEAQRARARAKLGRAELSADDEALLLNTSTQYKAQIDNLATQAAQISEGIAFVHPDSVQGRQLSELGKRQERALVDALAILQNGLSVEGSQKLQVHVRNIKHKMKMYPPPPNMPAF